MTTAKWATTIAGATWLLLSVDSALAVETTTPGAQDGWDAKDTITLTVAIVGAVTGVLGAVLGIVNTWNTISARKVRVVVRPTFAYGIDIFGGLAARPRVGIEVVNLSTFPVTVTEVGFALAGTKARANVLRPIVIDGKPWPRRLEAREAVSTYCDPPDDPKARVKAVYASLATGERFTRRGRFVKNLRQAMAEGHV